MNTQKDGRFPKLMAPIEIGGVPLRNRLVCSPVSTSMAGPEGSVSKEILDYYSIMGDSQAGLVTIGATAVSPEGASTARCMRIDRPVQIEGLKALAAAVKATGAVSALQLFHAGAQGNTAYTGQPVLGPSPYICPDIGITARPLEENEIKSIERDFIDGVLVGLDCGFDFVELHLAHGYLLHNFLSSYFNRREDKYGGPAENRLRIVENIVAGIEARASGAMKRVGARISGHDFIEDGLTIAQQTLLVDLFENHGAAYWVVSAGIYETAKQKYIHMRQNDYWRYAAELKALTNIPVIAQGGVRNLDAAEGILERGEGDLAGMAQALIADPGLIKKTLSGEEDSIGLCTECHRCRYIRRDDWKFGCPLHDHFGSTKLYPSGGTDAHEI